MLQITLTCFGGGAIWLKEEWSITTRTRETHTKQISNETSKNSFTTNWNHRHVFYIKKINYIVVFFFCSTLYASRLGTESDSVSGGPFDRSSCTKQSSNQTRTHVSYIRLSMSIYTSASHIHTWPCGRTLTYLQPWTYLMDVCVCMSAQAGLFFSCFCFCFYQWISGV